MIATPSAIESREYLLQKLKWLMFSRVVMITFLLGSTVLINFKENAGYLTTYLLCLYAIIVSTYLLNLVYILVINRINNLISFAYLQIILDLFYVTAIVYITGGVESIFSFLYILSIINASILLYRRGGFIIASASSILYGTCLELEFYGIIPPLFGLTPSVFTYKASKFFYTMAMNITGFYVSAYLSSLLAEQVRTSREEFKQLEALHENIVQSIGSGILTINRDGEITYFNKTALEITGLNIGDILGKNLDHIFPLPQKGPQHGGEGGLFDYPKERFEITFFRPNGSKLFLGLSSSILRDKSGKEMGKIYIFQDLTRHREMEEQIKRMDRLAAVGQLAAGIAHEIRNPLTSLSGSIQVLRDELDLNHENRRLMDIALEETKRLNNLITDFLLFAQPEPGEKNKINLSSLIEETLDLFKHTPECQKSIRITQSVWPALFIEGNTQHIKQVFWNIFKNASQAQPEGGLIHVEAKEEGRLADKNSKEMVKISIKDSGCGIPKEIQKNIFDPFFTTKDFGSGLGLAISHRIIENHKGAIRVFSRVKHGTEVVIYFPLMANQS